MKNLIVAIVLVTIAAIAWAGTGFFKYETKCTGFKKACVYDHLGDDIYITVDCVSLCPLSIEVD